MAKAIMVANDVYDRLSDLKGERSFTEIIRVLLEKNKGNSVERLLPLFGSMRDDKEAVKVKRDLKREWESWNKKYA